MQRRHFKQTISLELRLEEHAKRLRQEQERLFGGRAQKSDPQGRQAETASHVNH